MTKEKQPQQLQQINEQKGWRGVPVQEGQTWADLSLEQRKMAAYKHENYWRTKNSGIENGIKATQTFSRG